MQVNIHEAKTHLSRLIEQVAAGEEIILSKAGKPRARLVPLDQPVPRTPGAYARDVTLHDSFFEALPDEELDAWHPKGS
jgi:prevent-host-death family protein